MVKNWQVCVLHDEFPPLVLCNLRGSRLRFGTFVALVMKRFPRKNNCHVFTRTQSGCCPGRYKKANAYESLVKTHKSVRAPFPSQIIRRTSSLNEIRQKLLRNSTLSFQVIGCFHLMTCLSSKLLFVTIVNLGEQCYCVLWYAAVKI